MHLGNLLPEMSNELANHHMPIVKDIIDGSWTLNPSLEERTPLRFQTYFNLSCDTLTLLLIKEAVMLHQELHQVKNLLRLEKMKARKVKK